MKGTPFENRNEGFQHIPIIMSKLCILSRTKGESLTQFTILLSLLPKDAYWIPVHSTILAFDHLPKKKNGK